MAWHDGYVTEIQYTTGFYRELTPALLGFVQLIRGVRPDAGHSPVTYCELGCGQGYSTNLLAAANPAIEFHANDFNPGQIAGARRLAAEAGLRNVHFHEASFEDLARAPGLPESFDFITLHGVYSWISHENRRHILRFIRERLRPGGVVYLSYNSLPGWAGTMPLRRLLTDLSSRAAGALPQRIDRAIEAIERLRAAKAGYLTSNQGAVNRFERMKGLSRAYIAHEYLNADWHPEYFADVARDLHEAKCTFVGSAHVNDHIDGLNLTPEMAALLAAEADPVERETLRDFLVNQEFRRDIFAKGVESYSVPALRQAWDETRFALITPRSQVKLTTKGRLGESSLVPEVYEPLLAAFADGPASVAQLAAVPALAELGATRLQEALLVLVGAGHLQPCLPAAGLRERVRSARAFNSAVLARAETSAECPALASPVTGGGVTVDRFTQLFLAAHQARRADAEEWIHALLEAQGQRLLKDKAPIEGKEATMAELAARHEAFQRDRLPLFQQLGIA